MTAVGIIPARHASSRFPGKPLVVLHGKPMIQWVCERASLARALDEVLVATDDPRIRDCVTGFGGRAVMTSPHHRSGTDRVAEVARTLSADVVVNIQGDEPLIEPQAVDHLVEALLAKPAVPMATLAAPLTGRDEWQDASVVKVVRAGDGRAIYFSRAPIPHARGAASQDPPPGALRHVGLYAYRRDFLLQFCEWEPTPLEELEQLEQLRALEHGAEIRVALTTAVAHAVDTPRDVAGVERLLREMHPEIDPRSTHPAPS